MTLAMILAACLAAAFAGWYASGLIPGPTTRGVVRATLIALLCSPGVLIGHGLAVVPALFALVVQPTIYTLGPMLIVWVIALAVILGVPDLRRQRSTWPPATGDLFASGYPGKLLLFGVIAAVLMRALIFAGYQQGPAIMLLKYALFFGGAIVNLMLCYRVTRDLKAQPLLIPLAFAIPSLVASPTVPFVWYAGGAIGGLAGSGRHRTANWIVFGLSLFLVANAVLRTYLAANAAPHVTIEGGVLGNAAMAVLYAGLGVVIWWLLRRRAGSDFSVPESSGQ